tara:strand:- start:99 stop:614 length:516 start_codon:yes stop_codon:yes gene_type:complete
VIPDEETCVSNPAPSDPALTEAQAPACPIPAPRSGLSGFEKAELLAIGVVIPALFAATQGFEWTLSFGALVAYSAGLILGHGLVRDLARLAIEGRKEPTESLLCLCAESTMGLAALGAGTLLLAIGIRDTVTLSTYSLTALVAGILALGFFAKDYVLVLRKVKDHGTVAVG